MVTISRETTFEGVKDLKEPSSRGQGTMLMHRPLASADMTWSSY